MTDTTTGRPVAMHPSHDQKDPFLLFREMLADFARRLDVEPDLALRALLPYLQLILDDMRDYNTLIRVRQPYDQRYNSTSLEYMIADKYRGFRGKTQKDWPDHYLGHIASKQVRDKIDRLKKEAEQTISDD